MGREREGGRDSESDAFVDRAREKVTRTESEGETISMNKQDTTE